MKNQLIHNSVIRWILITFLIISSLISILTCCFAYWHQQGKLLSELDMQLLQVEYEYRNLTEGFWAIYLPVFEEKQDNVFLKEYLRTTGSGCLSPMEKLQLTDVLSHMAVRDENVQWIAVYSPRREVNYIFSALGNTLQEIPENFPYLDKLAQKEKRMEIYVEDDVRIGEQDYHSIAIAGGVPGRAQGSSIIVGYNTIELDRLCEERGDFETLRFEIVLNHKAIYSSGEQDWVTEGYEFEKSGIYEIDKERWYIKVSEERLRGARACYAVKWSELFQKANGYTVSILGMIFSLTGLAVGVYFLVVKSLTKEVNIIREGLTILGKNQLDYRIQEHFHQPELSAIAESVNKMSENLQENINRTREYEKRQIKSELQELQAKFNPHFLYNTLELFRTRCYQNGDEETAELIAQTASIFRGFIGSRTFISLEEELAFSRRYMALFRARYGDSVKVIYDIDTSVLEYGIIRNVFQPIIENYFEHGYNPANEKNYIHFRGHIRDEETILFLVEDNGLGMEDEALRELNEQLQKPILSEKESYGLRNLHQRLRLFYGEGCGLTLHSGREGGLVIEIIIRRKKCQEEI